ncbi:MAG: hypothetical protein ABIK81_04445, partial [candidate division WOR-3 bacterium]
MRKGYFKNFLLFIIFLFLGFLISRLPFPDMKEPARITLGILSIAIFLWITEIVPLYITSFVILFLEVLFLTKFVGD